MTEADLTIRVTEPEFSIESIPKDVQDLELIIECEFSRIDFSGLNRNMNSVTIVSVSNDIEGHKNDFEIAGFEENFKLVYHDCGNRKLISEGLASEEYTEVVEQCNVLINGFIIDTITIDGTSIYVRWP